MLKDIDRLCNDWVEDMKENVVYKKRKLNLSKIPLIGSTFEIFGLKEIDIKAPILFPQKSHLFFINDLYTN